MARFCPKCGTQADETTRFCAKCGNPLEPAAPPPPPAPPPQPAAVPTPPPPVVTTPTAAPPSGPATSGGRGCGKVILIFAIIVGLVVVLGIAGAAYLAYRAKKKVDAIHDAYKANDIEKMAEALGGKKAAGGHAVEAMPTFPVWPGGTGSVVAAAASGGTGAGEQEMGSVVPLKKGLTIVTAIQQSFGDYESIKEIKSVTSDSVLMSYSADHIPAPPNPFEEQKAGATPKPGTQSEHTQRKILRGDLQNAHEYSQMFSSALPLTLEGTTALGVSAAVLNDLKTKGETDFAFQQGGLKGALGGLLGGLSKMAEQQGAVANSQDAEQLKKTTQELQDMSKVKCQLRRTDEKTYAFPVLVNGQATQVPAIRAACDSGDEKAEFYFLDDPGNPLSLSWKLGDSDRLQVVKIDYVTEKAAQAESSQLEQKLQEQQKVDIYGIYFDFASAEIRPQSKPTLDEIAAVMKAHPDWRLSVRGHTDNIGGDAFNLDLSKKRAESVKKALVEQYQIAPERLETDGFGASQPVDTNDTMEGRAKNRRVELSRL